VQTQNHSKIQPALTRPDIADVTGPLLVWRISFEVTIRQVRRDIEFVIAVSLASVNLIPRIKFLTLLTLCLRVRTTDMAF